MRADLAAHVANAVRQRLWSDLAVCPPEGGWRTVRGEVRPDWVEENLEGFVSRTGVVADALHLDEMDFEPTVVGSPRPTTNWWVRYPDVTGAIVVKRLAEPMRGKAGGRFMWGPLKPVDRADNAPL